MRLDSTASRRSVVAILAVSWLAMPPDLATAGPLPPSCDEAPYDVDGNSQIEPLTDGLLLLRYFFGFRGSVLVSGAVAQNCLRCGAPEIEDFIAFALDGCPVCGDDVIDAGEECDGDDLGNNGCTSFGYFGGTLSCASDCTFDLTACSNCGNQVVDFEDGEVCDGNDLGGATCESIGYSGGTLGCDADCVYDDTDCIP
jgi:hypothetical protein